MDLFLFIYLFINQSEVSVYLVLASSTSHTGTRHWPQRVFQHRPYWQQRHGSDTSDHWTGYKPKGQTILDR